MASEAPMSRALSLLGALGTLEMCGWRVDTTHGVRGPG